MRKVFLEELPLYNGKQIFWKHSIGQKVSFVYDEVAGIFDIKDYDANTQKLTIIYKNIDFAIPTASFRNCRIRNILSSIPIADENYGFMKYIDEDINKLKNIQIFSDKYINIKCPFCGFKRKMTSHQLYGNKSIACPRCSDGKSYPEKYMISLLEQIGEDFQTELRIDINDKFVRYDFYLPKHNLIIEVDGKQHYEKSNRLFCSKNDKFKNQLATDMGYKLVRIDCSYSKMDYIKTSIVNSKLNEMFDLSNINWNKCDADAMGSIFNKVVQEFNSVGYELNQISQRLHISRHTVRKCLSSATELGLCNFTFDGLKEHNKNQISDDWMLYFDVLREYINETKCGVVHGKTVYKGLNLGVWCVGQRKRFQTGVLSDEKEKKLRSVGFVFNKIEHLWMQGYEYLKQYVSCFEDTLVPHSYVNEENYPLGRWVGTQRDQHKKNRLKEWQLQYLKDINFVFDVLTLNFENKYSEAEKYYLKHASYIGYKDMGWITRQRKAIKDGVYGSAKIARLSKIGITNKSEDDILWEHRFVLLKKYIDTYKSFPRKTYKTEDGICLGLWVSKQRQKYKAGILESWKIEILKSINFIFDGKEIQWKREYIIV